MSYFVVAGFGEGFLPRATEDIASDMTTPVLPVSTAISDKPESQNAATPTQKKYTNRNQPEVRGFHIYLRLKVPVDFLRLSRLQLPVATRS